MLRATSLALLVVALVLPWSELSAQEYPSRTVRMMVPLGVGGPPIWSPARSHNG
jgi:tripartite-type tricarboxylate transporter receptor subunit TctC